jgi:septal ring factor EnvC (AmiA/AmiB activator)
MDYELQIRMTALNQASSQVDKVASSVNNLDSAAKKTASGGVGNFGKTLESLGSRINVLGQRMTWMVSVPLLAFGNKAIETALDIEKSFVRLRKVFSGTEEDFIALKGVSADLAIKFGRPIEEINDVMAEFNKAGITSREELSKLGDIVSQTAIVFDTDMKTALEGTKAVMLGYNLTVAETEVALAKINIIADKTTASEEGILQVFSRAAGTARLYGFSLEALAASQSAFEKNAIPAGKAGNAMKSILISLNKQSVIAKEQFNDLGISIGDKKQQFEFLAASMDKTEEEMASMGITVDNAKNHFKDLGLNIDGAMGKFASLNINLGSFVGGGKESTSVVKGNSAATKEWGDKLKIAQQRLKEVKKAGDAKKSTIMSLNNTIENYKEKISGASSKVGTFTKKIDESSFRTASAEDKLKALALAYAQVSKNNNPKEIADFGEAITSMFGKFQSNNVIALLQDMSLEFDNLPETISQYYLSLRVAKDAQEALKWELEQVNMVLESNPQKLDSLNEKYRLQSAIIGNELLPIKMKLLEVLTGLIEKFNNLSPGTQDLIVKFGVFITVIGPLLAFFGLLTSGVGFLISAFSALGTGIAAVATFVGGGFVLALVAAIVALAAIDAVIITKAIKSFNELQAQLQQNREWIDNNSRSLDDLQTKVGSLSTENANSQLQNAIDRSREADKQLKDLTDRYSGLMGVVRAVGDQFYSWGETVVNAISKAYNAWKDKGSKIGSGGKGWNFGGVAFNTGGLVYASSGFLARGRDTVPAMLTPGEMVLNKSQQTKLFDVLAGRTSMQTAGGPTVNINVGTMVASRGEQREFARKIEQLISENNNRY